MKSEKTLQYIYIPIFHIPRFSRYWLYPSTSIGYITSAHIRPAQIRSLFPMQAVAGEPDWSDAPVVLAKKKARHGQLTECRAWFDGYWVIFILRFSLWTLLCIFESLGFQKLMDFHHIDLNWEQEKTIPNLNIAKPETLFVQFAYYLSKFIHGYHVIAKMASIKITIHLQVGQEGQKPGFIMCPLRTIQSMGYTSQNKVLEI